LLTFFAAAKKVSAAPHRDEANKPISNQGEANAVGKPPKANLTRPVTKQGDANATRTTTKTKAPQANNQSAAQATSPNPL
jgi:hypothetical protein